MQNPIILIFILCTVLSMALTLTDILCKPKCRKNKNKYRIFAILNFLIISYLLLSKNILHKTSVKQQMIFMIYYLFIVFIGFFVNIIVKPFNFITNKS